MVCEPIVSTIPLATAALVCLTSGWVLVFLHVRMSTLGDSLCSEGRIDTALCDNRKPFHYSLVSTFLSFCGGCISWLSALRRQTQQNPDEQQQHRWLPTSSFIYRTNTIKLEELAETNVYEAPAGWTWRWFPAAMLELLSCWLTNLGFAFLLGSTVQVGRNLTTPFVALFRHLLIPATSREIAEQSAAHPVDRYFSWFLIVLGSLVTIVALVLQEDSWLGQRRLLIGMSIVCFSGVCSSLKFVLEENLLRRSQPVSPVRVLGLESLTGVVVCGLIIAADIFYFQFMGSRFHLHILVTSVEMKLLAVSFVTTVFLFQLSSLIVIAKSSALLRSLIHSLRTLLTYFIELQLEWVVFDPLLTLGLIASALGFMVYANTKRDSQPHGESPREPPRESTAEVCGEYELVPLA